MPLEECDPFVGQIDTLIEQGLDRQETEARTRDGRDGDLECRDCQHQPVGRFQSGLAGGDVDEIEDEGTETDVVTPVIQPWYLMMMMFGSLFMR